MTALLLALALAAEPCDLKALVKEEQRVGRAILALPDGDPRIAPLFEKWERAAKAVDTCQASLEAHRSERGLE